jgi:hypothetical protein
MGSDIKFNRADSQSRRTRECTFERELRILVGYENEQVFHAWA